MSTELYAIKEKIIKFLEDEDFQNSNMNDSLRYQVLNGVSADELPDGIGEFGRTPENPIPVNGVIGELVYLSRLATKYTNKKILFHRIGSLDRIDAYETVSIDGRTWDILFFSLYHPRKSRKAPKGYQIVTTQQQSMIYGTNRRISQFPIGLQKAIREDTEKMIGISLATSEVRIAEETIRFQRPEPHTKRLQMAYQGVKGWKE